MQNTNKVDGDRNECTHSERRNKKGNGHSRESGTGVMNRVHHGETFKMDLQSRS